MRSLRPQNGDTIVEVLIAMAIVSMVLVSAFVVMNQSLQNTRQTQEHEEALKYTESQVELLAASITNTTVKNDIMTGAVFCFNSSNAVVAAPCSYGTSSSYSYVLTLQKFAGDSTCSTGCTVKAASNWVGPTGINETVEILYKVYP